MDKLVERCAGLDVHKETIVACVRVPGGRGRDEHIQRFGTTTPDLLALRDWLLGHGVTLVGMEATGVYWKPPFYVLEDAMECWLLNAHHLRNVPGRKTDMADAAWIAQLIEHGLVKPSFVPPPEIRELRNRTRYRKAQLEERAREAQRLDKILQHAGIKLSNIATDVLGVSGRSMLDALIHGGNDPEALAELAKGRMRKKIPELQAALTGRFGRHHAILVGEILAKIDYLEEAIERLTQEVDRVLLPFAEELALLDTIPGVNRRSAEGVIAEIGADMSRFGSPARLASWAGMCPGQHESAGKQKKGTTRKGSKWLRTYLAEAAHAASKTKGTYLAAQYARLRGRHGPGKATVAVGHSILVSAYFILDRHQPYNDLGGDWFVRRRNPERHANKLVRQLQDLGYKVTIEEAVA